MPFVEEGETITVNITGKVTGTLWYGKFKVKQSLSMRDQLTRDKITRELAGTLGTPGAGIEDLAFVLADLSVRIIESPSWWKELNNGLDSKDWNMVKKVWDMASEVETKLMEEIKKRAEEAKGTLEEAKKEMVKNS